MERSLCLVPGLFRSLPRGARKRQKLDVVAAVGEGVTIRCIGFEPLAADDMRLLQGLIALAGPEGLLLRAEPTSAWARQLRSDLHLISETAEGDALVVSTGVGRLLREIGLSGGGENFKAIRTSLIRLSSVTMIISRSSEQASVSLISHHLDEATGRVHVALNPRIASAILGQSQHSRIDMNEIRLIKSDPARLIHQRLCGWIDPSACRRVTVETLCSYVWPAPTKIAATEKKRFRTVRRAIAELEMLGWKCKEYVRGKFEISRPGSPSEIRQIRQRSNGILET